MKDRIPQLASLLFPMTTVSDRNLFRRLETGFELLSVLGYLEWFEVKDSVWVDIGPEKPIRMWPAVVVQTKKVNQH